jgi:predicted signal transduction protein with EAL and GGDEF domain
MHLETLAEGIEELGQLTQLQAQRCDVVQGFLLARPIAPKEVEAFLGPAPAVISPTLSNTATDRARSLDQAMIATFTER